jgi:hypothetical protein
MSRIAADYEDVKQYMTSEKYRSLYKATAQRRGGINRKARGGKSKLLHLLQEVQRLLPNAVSATRPRKTSEKREATKTIAQLESDLTANRSIIES